MRAACVSEIKDAYKVLVGKPTKMPRGRPMRRRKDNIKINLKGGGCMEWSELAPDRERWRLVVSAVIYLRVQ